jgi:hypothetical protein
MIQIKKWLIILATIVFLILSSSASAYYKVLSDSLMKDAIQYAKEHKRQSDDFDKPWTFTKGSTLNECTVMTPYFVLAARFAEASRLYEKFNIDNSDRTGNGFITFAFSMTGDLIDLASGASSVIKIDTLVVKPVLELHCDSPLPSPSWPRSPAYCYLSCLQIYKTADIPQNAKIEFIIILWAKEIKYYIDLRDIK